jgi:Ca2+-binding EF-hand superfamily protein
MTTIRSTIAAFAFAAILSPSFAEETKPEAPKTEPAKDAPAKQKPKPDPAKAFKKKDADSDGFLSKEEFTKGAKDAAKAETAFGKRDKDGDGKISMEEFAPKPKGKGKGKKQK